jgi:acetyltransferase-like isoleucine patch superfamily enzyme
MATQLRLVRVGRRLASAISTVFGGRKNQWPAAQVSDGAIIQGDASRIVLGDGCLIEPGAVLSAEGGSIHLGRKCAIRRGAMIMTYGGNIVLGDECSVNPYTILYGHGGLRVGSFTRFAAHSVVIPANHSFDDVSTPIYRQAESRQGIAIGSDVWVGTGVRVLDGVSIGDGAVVGAGAVVTKDLPRYSISVGVPARVIGFRDRATEAINADGASASRPDSDFHDIG